MSADGSKIAVLSDNMLAKIYQYDAHSLDWVQLGQEIADPYTSFGFGSFEALSLSSDGSTIAVGANAAGTIDPGFTSIFRFDSTTARWIQLGSDIIGENLSDRSGTAVSLSKDGSTVAIGANQNFENGTRSGHTRIYRYDDAASTWIQLGSDIDGEAEKDESGYSVSISDDGSIVFIGAPFNDGGGNAAGHTRVYRFDEASASWIQIGSDIDGEAAADYSGLAISTSSDGSTVAVGAKYNDGIGKAYSGHVRVHKLTNLTFSTLTSQSDSTTALTLIDEAHSNLSTMRATYGAVMNRITHAIDNLSNTLVNTESSASRIADTDYAKESSNLASAQIRNQGAKAMLAQANTDQQLTLSLLEDWL
jgi:flagellin-like hook-associated protein FlgL